MKTRISKKLAMLVCLLALFFASPFVLSACEGRQEYAYDEVIAYIYDEYIEAFQNEEITLADFNFENIESIHFHESSWSGFSKVYVNLKRQGKRQVNEAVAHLAKLYFVSSARLSYIDYPT